MKQQGNGMALDELVKPQTGETSEHLWNAYTTVNEWIRFSDTKAGAVLAANGLILSVALQNADQINALLTKGIIFHALLLFGGSALILSTFYAIKCLMPTLKIGEPVSLIFFAHIARKYKSAREYEEEAHKVFGDRVQLKAQLSYQVWANARVADRKYKAVTWTFFFLAVTIGFIIAAIILSVIV